MIGNRIGPVFLSLLLLAGLAGCAQQTAAPTSGPAAAASASPEMIAQGRTLFTTTAFCHVCHGQTARGGTLGPNLADSDWIWVQPQQDLHSQLVRIIRDGIPQPRQFSAPMPAMGGASLSDAQIQAIAAFVVSLQGQ